MIPIAPPKVSVCVIAFNQEQFIAQCLQSIVDQVANFSFEVIVGDDCSSDATAEIIAGFASRYPNLIRPIYQHKNIGGGVNNLLTVHAMAAGEYVAHVDGDDYLLPGKLQAQADLLDADPECNLVFHRMQILGADGSMQRDVMSKMRALSELRFTRADILQFMAVGLHSSTMYRRNASKFEIPDLDIIDYFLNVEHVSTGVARYVDEKCYGVYRLTNGIASSGVRPRRALAETFVYFLSKYPEHRLEINTAALTCLLADLRRGRSTWSIFFLAWIRTFHFKSLFRLLRSRNVTRQLRFSR